MAQTPTFEGVHPSLHSASPFRDHAPTAAAPADAVDTHFEGPYKLVLAFVFFYYAYPRLANLPGGRALRVMLLLLGLTTAWLVLEKISKRLPFVLSWPESHALGAFLAAAGLTAANSYWPGATVGFTMEFAKGVAIYFLMVNAITDRRRLRGFYWAWVLGGAFAAFTTLQWYFSGVSNSEGRAIYTGTFRNPNDLAMALTIVVPLAICLLRGASRRQRLVLLACIAGCALTVFFTQSRGGYVGFAAAMAMMAIRGGPTARKALAVAVLVAALVSPFFADSWTRPRSYSNLDNDRSFQNRIVSVEVGWAMFLDSPLIGIGFGVSKIGFPLYAPRDQQHADALLHNMYAQLMAETGMLGTFLYVSMFLFSLLRVDRVARGTFPGMDPEDRELRAYAGGVESSIVGFAVCAMAGPYLDFWVPLFLIAACSAIGKVIRYESLAKAGQQVAAGP